MTQTDPISAATAYRMALDTIAKAGSLATAVRLAQRALLITFTKPEDGMIHIGSGYGYHTKTPFVTVGMANPSESANPTMQLTSAQARQQAMYLLEAADAADSDGFVIEWLASGTAELGEAQLGALLADFRAFRERQRRKDEA